MTDQTPQTIVITDRGGPGFLVRIVWYVFIGWWLSGLAIMLSWILAVSIIGLPLAFAIFNRIPAIMTLRGRTLTYEATVKDGVTDMKGRNPDQRPMLMRALYLVRRLVARRDLDGGILAHQPADHYAAPWYLDDESRRGRYDAVAVLRDCSERLDGVVTLRTTCPNEPMTDCRPLSTTSGVST